MDTKYLTFEFKEQKPRTEVWLVRNKNHGNVLGEIRFFAQWRQYSFIIDRELMAKMLADPDFRCLVFSRGCLKDINAFIEFLQNKLGKGRKSPRWRRAACFTDPMPEDERVRKAELLISRFKKHGIPAQIYAPLPEHKTSGHIHVICECNFNQFLNLAVICDLNDDDMNNVNNFLTTREAKRLRELELQYFQCDCGAVFIDYGGTGKCVLCGAGDKLVKLDVDEFIGMHQNEKPEDGSR